MKIWQKLTAICLLFSLPLVSLAYLWLSTQRIQIEFGEKEINGNQYLRPTLQLLDKASQLKRVIHLIRKEDNATKEALSVKQSEVDAAIKEIEGVERKFGKDMESGDEFNDVKQSWTNLKNFLGSANADTGGELADELIAHIRALISKVGDKSNLILDPDLDSYYVMDITLLRIPEGVDLISKMQIQAESAASRKILTDDEKIQIAILSSLIKANLDGIKYSFEAAVKNNSSKNLKPSLDDDFQRSVATVESFLSIVQNKLMITQSIDAAPNDFYMSGSAAANSLMKFYGASVDQLDLLLENRIDGFNSKITTAFTLVALVILITIVLVFFVAQSITKPLQFAVTISEQLSEGDLSNEIVTKADDETGQLLTAMGKMIANFRDIIKQITESSDVLATTAVQLSANGKEISKGAEEQSAATEETSSSMEEMAASITQVASNAESLTGNAGETSTSIQQMASSIQLVSRNAENLSASVVETSSMIEEMAASIEQVSVNAREAGKSSEAAVKEAQDGGNAVTKTIHSMEKISATMTQMVSVIQKLNESSKKISNIVEVIDDIAEQTNLLALNAAIEAARAGEHGRGFAVVADEVRKLAERSASSAKEIVELISGVQKDTDNAIKVTEVGSGKVTEGMVLATQAGEALNMIVQSISGVNRMMLEIAKATEQQARASEQAVKTMDNMTRLTQQVSTATKEQAIGSQQIMKAVEMINNMTKQVSNATSEQKLGGEQVVKAIDNIAKIAEQNVSAAAQIVSVTGSLKSQSEQLRKVTSLFKFNINGRSN